MRRTSEEVEIEILRNCPSAINRLMLKANVCTTPIYRCLEKGLIKRHEESGKVHKMIRKGFVKIYRVTEKGLGFLQNKDNVKNEI